MNHETTLRHLSVPRRTALLGLFFCGSILFASPTRGEDIRFTSVPDLFNWNISNPQPGWEDTLDWFFDRLKTESPDFILNAGDIMDARWWEDEEQVKRKTEEYWIGFKKRFDDRKMTVYVAPGDHEYGDDGGLKIGPIARAFGKQFTELMGMPQERPRQPSRSHVFRPQGKPARHHAGHLRGSRGKIRLHGRQETTRLAGANLRESCRREVHHRSGTPAHRRPRPQQELKCQYA